MEPQRAPGPEHPKVRWILIRFRRYWAMVAKWEKDLQTANLRRRVAIRRSIDRAMEDIRNDTRKWTGNQFKQIFDHGTDYASRALNEDRQRTGLTRHARDKLADDTFEDLAHVTRYVSSDMKRYLRDVAKERVQVQVGGGRSIREQQLELERRLRDKGFHFVDKSGRHWGLTHYTEMVVRTKSAQAYNTGTILRAAELGVNQFRIFDGKNDLACALADGKVVDAKWALANPVAHPNCVRSFGPLP